MATLVHSPNKKSINIARTSHELDDLCSKLISLQTLSFSKIKSIEVTNQYIIIIWLTANNISDVVFIAFKAVPVRPEQLWEKKSGLLHGSRLNQLYFN